MAEEEEKILADARKLPYIERVTHKNWKARSEAYEGMREACERALSNEDDCFTEFGERQTCSNPYQGLYTGCHSPILLMLFPAEGDYWCCSPVPVQSSGRHKRCSPRQGIGRYPGIPGSRK